MKPRVEAGRPADWPALSALEAACFARDRQSPRSLRYLLTQAQSETLVVRNGRELSAALILLYRVGSRVARVYSIAVSPVARGQGLAQKLLGRAERSARARGCDRMRSEVRRDNTPSRRLFEAAGYVAFACTPDYYEDGMEALRYEKRLK